jgi:predicted anti-sigma-YlaC factor YlaD
MDCRAAHVHLNDYLRGTLDTGEAAWFKEHIQDCPDCFLLDRENRKQYINQWVLCQEQTA